MIKQLKLGGTCLLVFAISAFAYFFIKSIFVANAQLKEMPFIKLETSDGFLEQQRFKTIWLSPKNEKKIFALEQGANILISKNQESGFSETTALPMQDAEILAVNDNGYFYVSDSSSSVKVISATGKALNKIEFGRPTSLSVYKNNLIVADASKGKLLHIYDQTGVPQKSFGELKNFDSNNSAQNQFLNRGDIAVSLQGDIYYAYSFATEPTIRKFSPTGQLLLEFPVRGEAINLQSKKEKEFLQTKDPATVGGIRVINSIAFDNQTNHIFIGTNGSAVRSGLTGGSGVIYEYNADGEKLREYALIFITKTDLQEVITGIKEIAVSRPWLYVLTTPGRIHRFNLETGKVIERGKLNMKVTGTLQSEEGEFDLCPQAQNFCLHCKLSDKQPASYC